LLFVLQKVSLLRQEKTTMQNAALHHISLTTKNLARAIEFYENVLEFKRFARPAFKLNGAWLQNGAVEIHLIDWAEGSFRSSVTVSTDDVHLAIRVTDFESLVSQLAKLGYVEELADDDGKRIIIKRNSMAGYHQLYIMDADRHVIEINAAI
jgi:catechol 2,3-dioxygenase-like lactoylglutathione lyase family enzyme